MQQHNATKSNMSQMITRLEAELSYASRETDALRASLAAEQAHQQHPKVIAAAQQAGVASILSSFNTALANLRQPKLAEPISDSWEGKGSPYMAHLTRCVHLATPHLV